MVFYTESGFPQISNVEEIRFYNPKLLDQKFICGECRADIGTEFIIKPYLYSDHNRGWCIVPNERDMVNKKDLFGNPKFNFCILNSECFFIHFIPCLKIKDFGWDDWRKRSDLVRNVLNYIAEPSRKTRILNHIVKHEDVEIRSYVKQCDDGTIVLDKSYLYYAFIDKLEWLISDIKLV